MKRYLRNNDNILCMSNIRGKDVVNPEKLPFSFYFSSGSGVNHSIRVKPVFNPDRLLSSQTGVLKLCDDWEYIPGNENSNPSQQDINKMKQFFKDNIVLFCMVWDEQITDSDVADYLKGDVTLHEMIQTIDFYEGHQTELDKISTVEELEDFCRDNKLVNFYGN